MGDRASVHHLRHVRSHVGGGPLFFSLFSRAWGALQTSKHGNQEARIGTKGRDSFTSAP